MIKAYELRPGNIILSPDTGQWVIVDLNHIKAIQEGVAVNGKHYEPIPITAEILEKCGATKARGYTDAFYLRTNVGLNLLSIRLGHPLKIGDSWWPEIKHLHRLQNLFFDLTEKELEIKLPL